MQDYFRTTVLLIFFAIFLYLTPFFLGCSSSKLDKHLQLRYPDCKITELNQTPYKVQVLIVCPRRESIIRWYRRN